MISKPARIYVLFILLSASLGCGKSVEAPPEVEGLRIVSLSPAITDILFEVGVGENIVGVSSYCILPEGQKRKVVGNMMSANTESLLAVRPTHLFIQGSPVPFQNLVRLDPRIRLEAFRIETISEILKVVTRVGEVANKPHLADNSISAFSSKIASAAKKVKGLKIKRTAFVIDTSTHQILAAGPGTFIDELISKTGGVNVVRDLPGQKPWRNTSVESLLAVKPEVLICQIDPKEKNGWERVKRKWSRFIGQSQLGLKRVEIVTDRRWTFPSTRIADLAEPLARILHPGQH